MTREQIAEACARAGLPQPSFGKRYATLRIRIGPGSGRLPDSEVRLLGELPDLDCKSFNRWCRGMSHAGVARFVNAHLGTVYRLNDAYHWRTRDKKISSNIRRLVRDYPDGPVDPKPRKEKR